MYVGFGSMGFAKDAAARREPSSTALARAGVRGVLATGWGGSPAAAADPNVISSTTCRTTGCFRGWRRSCTTAARAPPQPDFAPAARR